MFIAEGLHHSLEAAYAAQRATALLLDEVSHRVKNKFAMVSSIISLQARRTSPEVRHALDDVDKQAGPDRRGKVRRSEELVGGIVEVVSPAIHRKNYPRS